MQERPWLLGAGLILLLMIAFAVARNTPAQPEVVGSQPQTAAAQGSTRTGDAIKISIATSSTKQEWIYPAITAFNDGSKTDKGLQLSGKPIFVEVILEEIDGKNVDYRSGSMVSATLQGKIKPIVLSPGEESWIDILKKEWRSIHGKAISTAEAPVLLRTPLVVAMWQSRARTLECWPAPTSQCTWERIRDLAATPSGWEMFGKPEWGKFKIGYGYFGESNSGTLSVVLMCMIGLKKTTGISVSDVDPQNGCGRTIAAIEKSKVHSGVQSGWLLDKLRTGGPEYLDSVITNELEVINFNRRHSATLREPLVSVYPQDGTMLFGHPFAILDGAPWVTPEQVEAAKVFQKFLLSRQQQELVPSLGLRPADSSVKLGSPFEAAYGANPSASLVTVELPDPLVIGQIGEVWRRVKKHAAIAVVFDKSGSMSGEKMNAAIAGAKEFISRMDREDYLMWMPFDNTIYTGTEGQIEQVGEKLVGDITSATAGGGTSLHDAVLLAYQRLEARRRVEGNALRYGIVVLSDGRDTNSKNTLSQLEAALKPLETDATGIQIHTIAIGRDADENVLKKIANSAHGRFWKGQTAQDMVNIYREIATYY